MATPNDPDVLESHEFETIISEASISGYPSVKTKLKGTYEPGNGELYMPKDDVIALARHLGRRIRITIEVLADAPIAKVTQTATR